MIDSHAGSESIRNPGPLKLPSYTQPLLALLAFLGLGIQAFAIIQYGQRGWISFLHEHFYFLSLALGGVFIASIQFLTGAMWSAPIRRLAESFSGYLPVVIVGFVILCFGLPSLYSWMHVEHVHGDAMLEHKAAYLNRNFFIIRNAVAVILWLFLSRLVVKNSTDQDATGDVKYSLRNKIFSPLFIVFFALTFTMASIDMVMSLDPHWFSTMFGVYCFAGLFYASLALTTILAVWMKRSGRLEGIVNANHLHDLGKFCFAFTVFWAYIAFSQFMLIWYANLPEETMYFMRRMDGSWRNVSIFLLLGKFCVPFFALLPREAKRNETRLLWVCSFMLVAQWVDILWLIQPEFYHAGPVVGWIELGSLVGFGALFLLAIFRFLSRHNLVAIRDPKIIEAVLHHHQ